MSELWTLDRNQIHVYNSYHLNSPYFVYYYVTAVPIFFFIFYCQSCNIVVCVFAT